MIYFGSDFHLGLPDFDSSLKREKKIIAWLDEIKKDATDIFFVGDIFEFWYEWKNTIPKHFSRFFGKLAELSDLGITLHYFTGNHDIWAYDYFEKEFGMKIYRKPQTFQFDNKKFYIAHGDGLGPNDKLYKLLKKVFTNNTLQWLVTNFMHPNTLFRFAKKISYKREAICKNPKFKAEDEWLVQHSREILKTDTFDYFIYGHRHIAIDYEIQKSKMLILGDWITNFTYGQFDGQNLILKKFKL